MALALDTSVIYASVDRRDSHYEAVRDLLSLSRERLLIPVPCLVEVDYLISTRLHVGIMLGLLDDVMAGAYILEDLRMEDYRRIRELCDRYADSDIGFVDAAVLAIVERLNEPKLATLDRRHFGTMRPRHVDSLLLLPA